MIGGAFNEWFTLCHKSRASDGQGGWTYIWAQYATEHGRMSRLGKGAAKSQERIIGAQLQEWASHLFFCRPGPESSAAIESPTRQASTTWCWPFALQARGLRAISSVSAVKFSRANSSSAEIGRQRRWPAES